MGTVFDKVLEISVVLLREKNHPTPEDIRTTVDEALRLFPDQAEKKEELARALESRFNIRIGVGTQLYDNSNHRPWLLQRKSDLSWRYWSRYASYLEGEKAWAPAVIESLQDRVDTVLGLLEDPKREGPWDRRGLVVGNVQSGKTSNYTGLICKAADAGYQLIVVLAGVHNSLRSQTQLRLDEGFLGYNSVQLQLGGGAHTPIGAGKFDRSCAIPNTITNRAETGDFKKTVAQQFNITPGGKPLLFVVKKHVSVLRNLLNWVLWTAPTTDDRTGRGMIPEIPLLVIDDEADYASIDTKRLPLDENGQPLTDHDPTKTNARIRELLNSFEKSSYVGYTATPFANVYIHEDAVADGYGPDLFPRAFIINLPTPSNYVGPAQVFGLNGTENSDACHGLPVVRIISDHAQWLPNKHSKTFIPGPLPDSLHKAIRSFILTCAARRSRGQMYLHNSMLIHVTRFTAVQEKVGRLVEEEVQALHRRLKRGDGNAASQLIDELRRLWEEDYVPTTKEVNASDCPPVCWSDVAGHLCAACEEIKVRLINGSAGDVLDYADNSETGLSVIAVGGDKLSRGLTLEGLSVSYYLRASRMYDTLMQMGRWFGYRPGYLDLCRLYTSQELVDWYEHITVADEELRELFETMASVKATPEDFGIRVRSHPDLLVTGPVKMRNGHRLNLSYKGDISETIFFHRDALTVKWNLNVVEKVLDKLGTPTTDDGGTNKPIRVWRHVTAGTVTDDFLAKIKVPTNATKVVPDLLAQYISACAKAGELTDWTIVLISKDDGIEAKISKYDVGMVTRSFYPRYLRPEDVGYYRIRRLVDPRNEYFDLTDEQKAEALLRTQEAWESGEVRSKTSPTRPSGPFIRLVRPKTNGLLLLYPLEPKYVEGELPVIGFALSFPDTESHHTVNYVVNNVYFKQEYGDE